MSSCQFWPCSASVSKKADPPCLIDRLLPRLETLNLFLRFPILLASTKSVRWFFSLCSVSGLHQFCSTAFAWRMDLLLLCVAEKLLQCLDGHLISCRSQSGVVLLAGPFQQVPASAAVHRNYKTNSWILIHRGEKTSSRNSWLVRCSDYLILSWFVICQLNCKYLGKSM